MHNTIFNTTHYKTHIGEGLLCAALLFGLSISPAFAGDDKHDHDKDVVVDCNKGKTITRALETGRSQRTPLTVLIKGVCYENVVIKADDVTLRGITADAGITGLNPVNDNTVLIIGASRVAIEKLTISGGRNGIVGVDGAHFSISDSHVYGNTATCVLSTRSSSANVNGNLIENCSRGVAANDSSYVSVTNNTVQSNSTRGVEVEGASHARIGVTNRGQAGPNTITGNGEEGIEVANGSNAYIFGNTISGNGQDGIALYRGVARMLGQNLVEANARYGVFVSDGSSLFQGQGEFTAGPNHDIIRANVMDGVRVFNGSSLDMRDASISDNLQQGVQLDLNSSMRVQNTSITNNALAGIQMRRDSSLLIQASGSVSVNGNATGIQCLDNESSMNGVLASGSDPISCTGF
jgi:parallel beta-helix repeat protein